MLDDLKVPPILRNTHMASHGFPFCLVLPALTLVGSLCCILLGKHIKMQKDTKDHGHQHECH